MIELAEELRNKNSGKSVSSKREKYLKVFFCILIDFSLLTSFQFQLADEEEAKSHKLETLEIFFFNQFGEKKLMGSNFHVINMPAATQKSCLEMGKSYYHVTNSSQFVLAYI